MQHFRFSQRSKLIFRSSGIECLVQWQIATEVAEEYKVSESSKLFAFPQVKQRETTGSLFCTSVRTNQPKTTIFMYCTKTGKIT